GIADQEADILEDPETAVEGPTRLHLVWQRAAGLPGEDEQAGGPPAVEQRRADAVAAVARRRGVRVTVLTAEGGSALERLASLVAVPDFASVSLALAHGIDPRVVPAGSELKSALSP